MYTTHPLLTRSLQHPIPPPHLSDHPIQPPTSHPPLQARRETHAIPHRRQEPHQIQQRANAMQLPKLLIQRNHLPTMRRRIIALLPIPRLLRLALVHRALHGRADDEQVQQRGHEDGGEGVEDGLPVLGREGAGEGGRGEGGGRGVG